MKLCLCVLLLAAFPPMRSGETTRFSIESIRSNASDKEDKIKPAVKEDFASFDFEDVRAIGGARIAPSKGAWPKAVVLQIRLRGLEQLSVSNGKATLTASVLSHSGHKRILQVEEAGKQQKVEKGDDAFWTNIRILDAKGGELDRLPDPSKGESFEVTLPQALFADDKAKIELHWIDFFRR